MTAASPTWRSSGTADSSALWAENRDLYALSDLLGYRYTTPTGRSYDIVDLAGTLDESAFPIESVLHGCAHLTRLARCGRADRIQQEPHRRSIRLRTVPRHADRRSAADRQGPALSETPASRRRGRRTARRGAGPVLPDRCHCRRARRRRTARTRRDRHRNDHRSHRHRAGRLCRRTEDGPRSQRLADIRARPAHPSHYRNDIS